MTEEEQELLDAASEAAWVLLYGPSEQSPAPRSAEARVQHNRQVAHVAHMTEWCGGSTVHVLIDMLQRDDGT
jgi:hypothetical protein